MPSPVHIPAKHLQTVRAILEKHFPDREVRAFGSRVTGKEKPTSDLDLCIMGDAAVEPAAMEQLRMAFSESPLPFKVDIVEWANLSAAFRGIIEKTSMDIRGLSSR